MLDQAAFDTDIDLEQLRTLLLRLWNAHASAAGVAADAELCMMAAACLEHLGIERGDYVVRVNNRKLLDGVMEMIGIDPCAPANAAQRRRTQSRTFIPCDP